MTDIVRVLRVIEYVGPRDLIEQQLEQSRQDGTHRGMVDHKNRQRQVTYRIATVGAFPEVLIPTDPLAREQQQ